MAKNLWLTCGKSCMGAVLDWGTSLWGASASSPSLGAREQAQGSVSPQAPPAWMSCVLLGGGGWWRGTATVCQNCLWAERGSGVARLELTHSGSFEMALHLRRLQQHGGEVAFFTESLWLRGWSCCGQRG